MNTLIRPGDRADEKQPWRALAGALAPTAAAVDPVLEQLRLEVAALRQALADSKEDHSVQLSRARAEAKADAEAHFQRDETKALALLKETCGDARAALAEKLAEMDGLALLFCETALTPILGDADAYRDLVTHAIRRQCDALARDLIVRVVMSAADFPNAASGGALAQSIGLGGVDVVTTPDIVAGACRIELKLGAIDLSVSQYWSALQARFASLVSPDPAK